MRSFNKALLLNAAMKVFNLPTVVGIFNALQLGYLNLRTRPMFRAAVRGNNPKHFYKPETFEPNHSSDIRNLDARYRLQTSPLWIDLPIGFQACQKMPAEGAHQLQVRNGRILTVETNHSGSKAAFVRFDQHLRKMVVLGFSIRIFIKNAVISRHCPVAVRPEQSNQIDAGDDFFLLARPMAIHERVKFLIGFFKRRIIENQNAARQIDLCVRASVKSVSGSGSKRCRSRVKASCAGASRLSGCTRPASVAVTSRGVAMIKLM